MDDNARPHRTRDVQQALQNGHIARLEWPAMSFDMNLIEHVWDYVSRAIFNRNNPPRSTQVLPQAVINNLIIGMHRRVDALIRSRGGNTNEGIFTGPESNVPLDYAKKEELMEFALVIHQQVQATETTLEVTNDLTMRYESRYQFKKAAGINGREPKDLRGLITKE
nr:unnamed protein product [Callosobruchus chinensis]